MVMGTRALGTITALVGSLQAGESFMVTFGLLVLSPPRQFLWSVLKFLNFYYMPLPYQVIVNTTLAVVYNLYFNVLKRMVIRNSQELAIREGQFVEE